MKKFLKILYIMFFIMSLIFFCIDLFTPFKIIINNFMPDKILFIIFIICILLFPLYISKNNKIISILGIVLFFIILFPFSEYHKTNTEFKSPKKKNTLIVSEYKLPLYNSQIAVYHKINNYICIEKFKFTTDTECHPFSDDNKNNDKIIWLSENEIILEFMPSNENSESIKWEITLK